MSAYAIAHLRVPQVHPDLVEYVERIQATLDPYAGRFLAHGGRKEVMEGAWPGSIVLLEFPDMETARAWHDSPAYQEILPLRTRHVIGDVVVTEGVPPAYDPASKAESFREILSRSEP
jgi:uncharacterized protein (DUF1330 family)